MTTSVSKVQIGSQEMAGNGHWKGSLRPAMVIGLLLAATSLLQGAQSVTLAWDPSTDPDVTGGIVYYGNASRNYPYHTNVGNVTRATVTGLQEGLTYYFAVTATNTAGLESDYSNEVSTSIPVIATNQVPAISTLADRVTTEDTVVGPLAIQVSDTETPAASLTVSGTSTNTALVPNSSLVFGGSSSNRTLTVRPATNSVGRTLVTVVVSDGTNTRSMSFLVTVNASTNTFDQWLRTRFSAQDLANATKAATLWGDKADPDKDGRDNLTEYALGLDPISNESSQNALMSAIVTATNRSYLTLTFPKRKNDPALVYTAEVSSNKVDWLSQQTAVRQTAVLPRSAEFDTVTFQDATIVEPNRPRFIRLHITKY